MSRMDHPPKKAKLLKRTTEEQMRLAVIAAEVGYRAHEQGKNLDEAFSMIRECFANAPKGA